ncbi:restriction endonuclease subunit S [Candidatus Thalassolituus haligoni]|jgi:type I restriction enzyme, S subunit|uniref:restriction endonuclease subunit S n=1 Tax=Candidatus Thalassolituus haligoni TaxID=3100113 RepID=UPI003514C790
MGSEWRKVKLEEVASEVTVGYVGSMTSEYIESGVPFLRSKNVDPFTVNLDDIKYISPEFNEKLKKSALAPGDVVIVRTGKPGTCAVIPDWLESANCSDLVIVRCGPEINNRFLAYYVNTVASSHVNAHLVGAVQQHFNVGSAKLMELSLPSLEVQEQIVSILSALDNKIALNRQINTTLESMAQALFKSWFVDFDPVIDNALAAGHDIPDELQARAARRRALRGSDSEGESNAETRTHPQGPTHPADVQQHFPDRFVFTEDMGWVPEGWEVVTLKEMTQKIGSGATPRGGQSVYQESGISLIRSQNIYDSDFVWDGLAFITDEAALQLKNVEVMEGDVLINITGASILRTCIVEPSVLPARVNQHVAIIRPKSGVPSRYLHLHLLNQKIKNHLMAQNAGASREAVTKGHLEAVPVLQPDSKVLSFFERYTVGMTDKSLACGASSKTLVDLRDSLLPKLLSGQITIPDAEQVLDEVL